MLSFRQVFGTGKSVLKGLLKGIESRIKGIVFL